MNARGWKHLWVGDKGEGSDLVYVCVGVCRRARDLGLCRACLGRGCSVAHPRTRRPWPQPGGVRRTVQRAGAGRASAVAGSRGAAPHPRHRQSAPCRAVHRGIVCVCSVIDGQVLVWEGRGALSAGCPLAGTPTGAHNHPGAPELEPPSACRSERQGRVVLRVQQCLPVVPPHGRQHARL